MTYDSETEAAARHEAALARAALFQELYEVERVAERLELAAKRRSVLYRFLGLTSSR